FKTVDSDDWLLDFPRFLDALEAVERQGGVDLFITNYYYEHADGKGNRSINFSNALPQGRVFTWDETRPFRLDQILMIHACTFRTALLRQTGLPCPAIPFTRITTWSTATSAMPGGCIIWIWTYIATSSAGAARASRRT
ncbi:MAG: hypothetical protein IJS55_02920, partial [Oscillospiraceae bacterium]|nr:hypothetical protein [Oscillospiraceae bacterium]